MWKPVLCAVVAGRTSREVGVSRGVSVILVAKGGTGDTERGKIPAQRCLCLIPNSLLRLRGVTTVNTAKTGPLGR